MIRIIIFVLVLLFCLLVGAFAYQNAALIELNYLLGSAELPLALICGLTFVAGIIFSILMLLPMLLLRQQKIRKLQKTVKAHEKEISNLRNLPLSDVN